MQLPAWNEALGLPRRGTSNGRCACSRSWPSRPTCWNTATFSQARREIATKVAALKKEAARSSTRILGMGGAVAAVENGYMKSQLVEAMPRRLEAIERGEQTVVGVNRFTETEPSPLAAGEGGSLTVPGGRARADRGLNAWRAARDAKAR